MINSRKKGFTLVELVIVIAVVAILAAVLIPTFSSLVKKANMSADQQAAKQMNTALAMYEAENGKAEYLDQVKQALDAQGINAYDPTIATPVSKGYVFAWNPEDGKIYIVESTNLPQGYKLLTNNELKADSNVVASLEAGGTVTLLEDITLSENIDLTKDLVIIGEDPENPVKITASSSEVSRLFNIVKSNVKLTLENVDISLTNSNLNNGNKRIISTTGGITQPALTGIVINVINSKLYTDNGYGINLTAGVKGAELNIKDTTINAFQPIVLWSKDSVINVEKSTIELNYDGDTLQSGGIMLQHNEPAEPGAKAEGNIVTVKDCTITSNEYQCAIYIRDININKNNTISVTNTTYNGSSFDSNNSNHLHQ